ncbi:MAG: hypothetical protein VKK04_12520 [Synechococcales bacterium]|nr:hypothetical protein [Synechococcales bacterium]
MLLIVANLGNGGAIALHLILRVEGWGAIAQSPINQATQPSLAAKAALSI